MLHKLATDRGLRIRSSPERKCSRSTACVPGWLSMPTLRSAVASRVSLRARMGQSCLVLPPRLTEARSQVLLELQRWCERLDVQCRPVRTAVSPAHGFGQAHRPARKQHEDRDCHCMHALCTSSAHAHAQLVLSSHTGLGLEPPESSSPTRRSSARTTARPSLRRTALTTTMAARRSAVRSRLTQRTSSVKPPCRVLQRSASIS